MQVIFFLIKIRYLEKFRVCLVDTKSSFDRIIFKQALITSIYNFYSLHMLMKWIFVAEAAQMYENGVLAFVDVSFLAEVHIRAFENQSTCGRYFCFNKIVNTEEEAVKLVRSLSPLIFLPPK